MNKFEKQRIVLICFAWQGIVRCYSIVYADESDDGQSTEIEALPEFKSDDT